MGASQSRGSKTGKRASAEGCCSEDSCCGVNLWTGLIITGFIAMAASLVTLGLSLSEVAQHRVMSSQSWLYYNYAMFSVTTAATIIFVVLRTLGQRVGGRTNPHPSNYHPYGLLFGGAWTMTVILWTMMARFRYTFTTADLNAFDDFDSGFWDTAVGAKMLIMWTAIFLIQGVFGLVVTVLYWNTVEKELYPVVSSNASGPEGAPLTGV